jgi:hypothetical protein
LKRIPGDSVQEPAAGAPAIHEYAAAPLGGFLVLGGFPELCLHRPEIFGRDFRHCLTKPTMFQISSSWWVGPNAGIPVILIPFLIIQNSCELFHRNGALLTESRLERNSVEGNYHWDS